eukprot:m.31913 g.31913  ORF g.31913 m.31913 type:complete len:681 (+) comp8360_c0_seq1:75-2117(+)
MAPTTEMLLYLFLTLLHTGSSADVTCDVFIAGGSTASLAAAITAAEADSSVNVCFSEITDWPGGQMTAGGVPAIDFGGDNNHPENQPASFRSAMESIPGDGSAHTATMGSGSPGACSVSTKCYLPNVLVEDWVMPRLNKLKNLQLFLNTVVKNVTREKDMVTGLTIIQRQENPQNPGGAWTQRLSDELYDWYSPEDSKIFTKKVMTVQAKVYIEATELGDMLTTGRFDYVQGYETPLENSTTVDSHCGQAQTLTFYMELLNAAGPMPSFPAGGDEGVPFEDPKAFVQSGAWQHTWSWRRSFCSGNRSLSAINIGDITQQNLGNDLDTAYLFLDLDDTRAQAATDWKGGLNMTALRMLEDRAYGWFWYLRNISSLIDPTMPDRLTMNLTTSGTKHGLSKMVYWRDTRRALGQDGFRLYHTQLRDTIGETGEHFYDSVAIGDYNDDCHHLQIPSCTYPQYMDSRGEGAKPYYIPLRALAVNNSENMLVAGKLMSQTFRANANTRLHPSEWTSGVAAGGTAVLMVKNNWTVSDALNNYAEVQKFLNSSVIGQPLNWSDLKPEDLPVGSACELGRCLSVDKAGANKSTHFHNDSVCGNSTTDCTPLASYEWLANMEFWDGDIKAGNRIYAKQDTVLKKSTAVSGFLPPNEVLAVTVGSPCIVVANHTFVDYALCIHHTHNSSEL